MRNETPSHSVREQSRMTIYGVGQDSQTREYIVYADGVPTARYRMLADALQHIEARREVFEEGAVAVETLEKYLREREQGGRS